MSKLIPPATQIGKAPYLNLKDLDRVIEMEGKGESIFLDFKELENDAFRDKKTEPKYSAS